MIKHTFCRRILQVVSTWPNKLENLLISSIYTYSLTVRRVTDLLFFCYLLLVFKNFFCFSCTAHQNVFQSILYIHSYVKIVWEALQTTVLHPIAKIVFGAKPTRRTWPAGHYKSCVYWQVASAAAGNNGWTSEQDNGVCWDKETSRWSGI